MGALVVLADGLIRRFAKRNLRRPTGEHLDKFSEPVGQILARHADLSVLGPDLIDVTKAAAATGNYLIDGPVTTPRATESAVPSWADTDDPTLSTPAPQSPPEPIITPAQVSFLS